jgi:hypothetical protein
MTSVDRPLPGVQRAYFYLVALVAVHMVVLGVANLLRVGAEIAIRAEPGGFTGLPFIFADLNYPNDVWRQQASLAVALLVVGLPAWLIHFGYAQRIARRAPEDRASAWRSFHLHLVIFVTALLVFGYGQRTLRLLLQGVFFGGGAPFPPFAFGLEPQWAARAAGAGAMALTAAAAFAYHLRVSTGDRRATLVAGRAATLRHFAFYGLTLIGIFGAASAAIGALSEIWQYMTDRLVPLPGLTNFGSYPPPAGPSREDTLRFQMLGAVPAIVAGVALWLGTWLPLQRGIRSTPPDGDVERRSTFRKLAIYLVVFVSAVAVLASGAFVLTAIIRRLLGDPVIEQYSSLYREIGTPLIVVVIFGAIWIFYRRVVAAEAAREAEQERAANIRRLYTYLIAAIGMTMMVIGLAGSIGVLGSIGMGIDTHSRVETAAYISLVLLGAPAWAVSWWQAINRLNDDERRSLPRRGYLYLALIAGVVGVLIFGSAVLYRLLNASLAGSFSLALWHDVWHFTVDAAISAGAFLFHLSVVRADRGAQITASTTEHPMTVLVRAIDAAAARARLASALEGQPDISVR